MYAVIKVGGKQYRVEQGQKLLVDRQPLDAGKTFTPEVLMTGGDAVVTDRAKLTGTVTAEVVEHLRGEKLKVFTFKPKRGFKKTRGHRSELSRTDSTTTRCTTSRVGWPRRMRTRLNSPQSFGSPERRNCTSSPHPEPSRRNLTRRR